MAAAGPERAGGTAHVYAIALGGNRRTRFGPAARTLAAALAELGDVCAVSPMIESAPVGPSARRFANAVALVRSPLPPPAMLARLKGIERALGRRRGRRWGMRPIDLDIILWSGGRWRTPALTIPHAAFRERSFVLAPLLVIAPAWRDPVTRLTVRQLHRRLTRPRPLA